MKNEQELRSKISEYLDDCCLDIQGISSSSSLSSAAEVQLARILTKIAIGAASIWWSVIEFKDFISNRKITKGL
jgi:hypothetical protein